MLNVKESLTEKISRFLKANRNVSSSSKALYFSKSKKKSFIIWIIGIAIFSFAGMTALFQKIERLKKKQKATFTAIEELKKGVLGTTYYLGKTPVPSKLAHVPYGEDSGIVVGVKEVNIRNIKAPYNASLIPSTSGYELFFRYDVMSSKSKYAPFYSHIGVVHLNDQFEQGNEEFKKIHVPTDYAEDPRAILVNNQLYLLYNALNTDNLNNRCMYVAHLDKTSFDVTYNTILDMNLQWIEKNWSPFEYIGADQKACFFLEYQISPRKLLQLPDPQVNKMENLILPLEVSYLPLSWQKKWGKVRGGTPAQKIGNEYLGFFHSSFKENGLLWYVMGAYTFEAHPPFRITGISNHPILFRGIFETPYAKMAPLDKRVIFPSGFVVEKQNDQELIHVTCGENDSSVKIITLDKENLMKSMNRFENNN